MGGSEGERNGSGSAEPMETTEAAPAAAEETSVTPEQRSAMHQIVDKVYKHREKEYVEVALLGTRIFAEHRSEQWPRPLKTLPAQS